LEKGYWVKISNITRGRAVFNDCHGGRQLCLPTYNQEIKAKIEAKGNF
jgi:hypothetical protein